MSAPPTDADLFYSRLLSLQAPPTRLRASAAVVPWRGRSDGRIEVYWVRRAASMAFMGGWWAFPGGGVSRRDTASTTTETRIVGRPRGVAEGAVTSPGPELSDAERDELVPDLAPGVVVAALRELFEETGLLPLESLTLDPLDDSVRAARRRLLAKEASFGELLAEHGWTVDASRLAFAGRWLTPPFAPMRFDNRFFLLHWPEDQPQPALFTDSPSGRGPELDRGEWIEPAAALERWRTGAAIAAPPILHLLRVLGDVAGGLGPGAIEDGHPRLLDTREADLGPFRRIEFRPGVVLLPLRTPTLPPATHTNAVLLGTGDAVLIDPSTPLEDEQQRLLAALDAFRADGRRIVAIWLTHHHPDHVGAVEVVRRHLDARQDAPIPVLAHDHAVPRLEAQGITVDGRLADGQRVDLGGDRGRFPVRVLHTPGHVPGHVSLYDETYGTLIAGDLASTLSTIVIDPPDGDMGAYLDSLERVAALGPSTLFPSHGPVTLDAAGTLRRLRRHRLEREEQVLEAHRAGRTTAAEIVATVYADVDARLHPVAERQVEAHLVRLRELGSIE